MSDESWLIAIHRTAQRIADQAVVADVECEGVAEADAAGQRWYDIRPLIDHREHSGQVMDINSERLAYAFARQLIERHPQHAHLVRITRAPA
jgi:hypothetical protein